MDIKVESIGPVNQSQLDMHQEQRPLAQPVPGRPAARPPAADHIELTEAAVAANDSYVAAENSVAIGALLGVISRVTLTPVSSQLLKIEHSAPTVRPARGENVSYSRQSGENDGRQFKIDMEGVVAAQDGSGVAFRLTAVMPAQPQGQSASAVNSYSDPVFVNFAGSAARVTAESFVFDLNADGVDDSKVTTRQQATAELSLARYSATSTDELEKQGFGQETVRLAGALRPEPQPAAEPAVVDASV